MKFSSTLFVASLAAVAVAAPGGYKPPGGGGGGGNGNGGGQGNGNGNGSGNSCGGNQVVQCCNTGGSNQKLRSGIFGIFSIILAPGTCSPIASIFNQNCGNTVAQCCNNQQAGIININLGQCIAFPFKE